MSAPSTIKTGTTEYIRVGYFANNPAPSQPQQDENCEHQGPVIVPCISQLIKVHRAGKNTETQVDVVFQKHNGKMHAQFTIKPINHHRSPAVVDSWMTHIHKIVKGSALEQLSGWIGDESKTCFIKAATLSNRVDEVYAHYECTDTMRNEAYAWAKQYGIISVRSWQYRDAVTIDDCTLSFTLEKWTDSDHVACVQSGIVGKNPQAIRRLSDMLTCINRINAGETMPCANETLACVAIFGDKLTTYRLSNVPTAKHRELAKKYESTRMIAYFATCTAQEWTFSHRGQTYMLTKRDNMVKSINQTFDRTVELLLQGVFQLDTLSGSPQNWAEIVAFANLADPAPLQRILTFAAQIGLSLDTAHIDAAAAAGKA